MLLFVAQNIGAYVTQAFEMLVDSYRDSLANWAYNINDIAIDQNSQIMLLKVTLYNQLSFSSRV